MIDNIISLGGNSAQNGPRPPDEVWAAAKTLAEYAASQRARYWEIGLTCSRLYAMGIMAFAPKLKKIRGSEKDTPEVHAHNAAVRGLKMMAERKADEVLFDLLRQMTE